MRYVEVALRPTRGYFHPFDELLQAEPGVREEAIHQMNLLDDGTAVILSEYSGSHERVEEVLDAHYDHAIAYQTSEVGNNTLMYAHIEPSDLVRSLLRIPREHGVVIDWPMTFGEGGALHVTVVGEDEGIRKLMPAIPDDVRFEVTRTGDYQRDTERLFAQLTDRQQEILRTAVGLGYYEEPRQVTYEDIAAELDCTATTVGEHLRKAESTVLREITP
ncbi:helix-turn-helix domain-containing protein [Halorarius halobius]|uniref:helix-turn-helix domain-containing protein n=1 Tax=Halorarius halobius TaxID=2962671 RepID=UPI0020CE0191|nr:helix-turn-helix domain-containing protein [Halorarius halobius]